MKYLKQFLIIISISFLGEILHYLIPLPIPASIYGVILMLVALISGIIKVNQIRDTAMFLIDIMPIMFIPAAVGLLESWGVIKNILVPALVITLVSTILVLVVSGRLTQFIIRSRKRGKRR